MTIDVIRLHIRLILLIRNTKSLLGLDTVEVLFRKGATIALGRCIPTRPLGLSPVPYRRLGSFVTRTRVLGRSESGQVMRVFDLVERSIVARRATS